MAGQQGGIYGDDSFDFYESLMQPGFITIDKEDDWKRRIVSNYDFRQSILHNYGRLFAISGHRCTKCGRSDHDILYFSSNPAQARCSNCVMGRTSDEELAWRYALDYLNRPGAKPRDIAAIWGKSVHTIRLDPMMKTVLRVEADAKKVLGISMTLLPHMTIARAASLVGLSPRTIKLERARLRQKDRKAWGRVARVYWTLEKFQEQHGYERALLLFNWITDGRLFDEIGWCKSDNSEDHLVGESFRAPSQSDSLVEAELGDEPASTLTFLADPISSEGEDNVADHRKGADRQPAQHFVDGDSQARAA